jgi:carboxypeptidase Taq
MTSIPAVPSMSFDASSTRVVPDSYRALTEELREASTLVTVERLLAWDQETLMPPAGAQLRSEQLALLAGMVHERRISPRRGELIAACEADAAVAGDPLLSANTRELRRDYDRDTRLPASLIRELTQTTSQAAEVWKRARTDDRFSDFAPWLERVFDLTRAKAECLVDGTADLYDPLIDDYEPGMTTSETERVFATLREPLVALIAELGTGRQPDDAVQRLAIPVERQMAFSRLVVERIGMDFQGARLDTSTHPFCMGVGPGDTRLTTRFEETRFLDSLSSSMHEAGHGLYDQGLDREQFGLPLGEAAGLGIHESQSRMWENLVGRSHAFWEWALPEARRILGTALEPYGADDLYAASNLVRPTLIRVDADEATYNLHVMLRFDLERALLSGDLKAAELPGAWSERIRNDLGLEVPNDRLGCLQDIHWSMGLVGYFPTYTLGNLYAAQLWETIRTEIPGLEDGFRRGEFAVLLEWLREKIHRHGRRFRAPELLERVTGRPPGPEPLLGYLQGKFRPLYGSGVG